MAFERLIEDYVKPGIQAEIERLLNEEINRATVTLHKRLRETFGSIAVNLSHLFDVQTHNDKIIITFDDKSARVSSLAYNVFEDKKDKA